MALKQKEGLRPLPPKTAQEAMASLIDPIGFVSPAIRDRIDAVRYDDLPEPLVEFMRAFKKELARYKIPMSFFEGWRTQGRQAELRAQGVSKAGPNQSPHQYGLAFDLVHATRGWKLHPLEWAQIGAIGHEVARKRKMPIEWGGEWKFYDPAHWQVKGWRNWKSVLDAKGLSEASRPTLEDWKRVVLKVDPAMFKRQWPFG